MNSKNIKRHLKAKLKDWVKHIDDEAVKKTIEENTIITGGLVEGSDGILDFFRICCYVSLFISDFVN